MNSFKYWNEISEEVFKLAMDDKNLLKLKKGSYLFRHFD